MRKTFRCAALVVSFLMLHAARAQTGGTTSAPTDRVVHFPEQRVEETKTPAIEVAFPYLIRVRTWAAREGFRSGDQITITEVRGDHPRIEPGGTYLVRGTYVLSSARAARLTLSLTVDTPRDDSAVPAMMGSSAGTAWETRQIQKIAQGSGTFALVAAMHQPGEFHVSFYLRRERNPSDQRSASVADAPPGVVRLPEYRVEEPEIFSTSAQGGIYFDNSGWFGASRQEATPRETRGVPTAPTAASAQSTALERRDMPPPLPTAFEQRVELLFRPPLAEQMALSPDGRRVAYTMQAGSELHVVILDLEEPAAKVRLNVDDARTVVFSKEKQHAQLRFLRWATADRLVLAPTELRIMLLKMPNITVTDEGELIVPEGKPEYSPKITAPIMAVDASGLNPTTLADASPTATSAPPILGFLRENREQLVISDNGLVAVDVRTGKQTPLSEAQRPVAARDGRLPLAPEMRRTVERELAIKFPRRKIELVDWSAGAQHALVHVTGGNDPGRVFVYRRPQNLLVEIFRDAPWLTSATLNDGRFFEFVAPDGARLGGYITWPRASRLKPPPLLVIFPSGFPGRAQAAFDPEAQVFADLGFVVVRLDHRSVGGVRPQDRGALHDGLDRVAVDDALAAIAWVAQHFPNQPFDRKHAATLGRGFGGYLAVRALQLRPEAFRAAIAIDAPMELQNWLFPPNADFDAAPQRGSTDIPANLFDRGRRELDRFAIAGHAESLTRPVFFLVEPARNETIEVGVNQVRAQMQGLKRTTDYLETEPGFAKGLPKARAAVYRRIEEFFNLNLYDYRVKLGPTTEVK